MIQWIKDNKIFVVLAIIAILLAIIVMLMISGNTQPVSSSNQPIETPKKDADISIGGSNVTQTPAPAMTMPPEMQPKPYVTVAATPTSSLPGVP